MGAGLAGIQLGEMMKKRAKIIIGLIGIGEEGERSLHGCQKHATRSCKLDNMIII